MIAKGRLLDEGIGQNLHNRWGDRYMVVAGKVNCTAPPFGDKPIPKYARHRRVNGACSSASEGPQRKYSSAELVEALP
jgi:hypothetical protein